jgi:Domain of unknown function (DUF6916)
MADGELTEARFNENLNTTFLLTSGEGRVELELVEVKRYSKDEQPSMERFSIYFRGPAEPLLPQQTYSLEHERMGTLDIFIVPISRNETAVRYEAVFNSFK